MKQLLYLELQHFSVYIYNRNTTCELKLYSVVID
jgi:hypothetical protein